MRIKQLLLVLACCLIPLIFLVALFLLNIPLNAVLLVALIVFCPVSHLLMMKNMEHSHQAEHLLSSSGEENVGTEI